MKSNRLFIIICFVVGMMSHGKALAGNNVLSLQNVQLPQGSTEGTLSVLLTNEDQISGFQCDLFLPAGIEVGMDEYDDYLIELARTTSKRHSISTRLMQNGALRIVCSSTTNATFTGSSGAVMNIALKVKEGLAAGNYVIELKNIVLTDPSAARYTSADTSATLSIEGESPSSNISFADAEVKRICVENWDTNGDGELSEEEAAAVKSIGTVFKENKTITSFDEFQYFTGVTSIGEDAFKNCSNLTSINIPEGVTSIGDNAFFRCSSLTSINIPEGVTRIGSYAFYYCSILTSITIPEGLTSIGNGAFVCCSSLNSFTIPESLTSIGCGAFGGWHNLTEIEVNKNNLYYQSIDGVLYSKDMKTIVSYPAGKEQTKFTIPSSVRSIGDLAFLGCSNLTAITIPEGVTYIGFEVFGGCSSLTAITIPEGVTSIDRAFDGCSSLTAINIPESVTSIGYATFDGCSSLTSITIPEGVTSIGIDAFRDCSSLTSITIPEGVTSIGWDAFSGCSSLKEVISYIEEPFAITDNVFQIWVNGGDQFTSAILYVPAGTKEKYQQTDGWKNFQNIVEMGEPSDIIQFADAEVKHICVENWDTDGDGELSEAEAAAVESIGTVFESNKTITSFDEFQYFTGVTKLEESAFKRCTGLTSITIPEGVTSIGGDAFYYCSSLTFINIPEGVTSIGYRAFIDCSSLTSITIPSSVTSIGGGAFGGWRNLTGIGVNKNNPNYQSIDGVLYSKDMKTIVAYPAGKEQTEYSIANGVTSIVDHAFYECSSLTSITIPESVTNIGEWAFGYCSSLTSINIPEGVTSIEEGAFASCSSLTSITIPEGVTCISYSTFWYCSSLTSITIPEGVTSIGGSAFMGCYDLTSITIPSSVTSIENGAFVGCSSLKEVISYIEEPFAITDDVFQIRVNGEYQFTSATLYVPAGTKAKYQQTDGWKNFQNIVEMGQSSDIIQFADAEVKRICVENWDTNGDGELSEEEAAAVESIGTVFKSNKTITSFDEFQYFTGVTKLEANSFISCSNLISITIPSSVTRIELFTFDGCSSLTSITIPEGVTSIDGYAFFDCNSLSSITIPEGVTSIGDWAFRNCFSLSSITIPEGVTSIGDGAFASCINLPEIDVDKNNSYYQSIDGVLYSKDMKVILAYPAGKKQTEFTIPSSVTRIGYAAFYCCTSLTSITIPEGVTSIGEDAFWECSSLTSITIPEGVTSIGGDAFWECSSLTSINIPEGVTSIGDGAFNRCFSLTFVTIPSSVTSIGNYAFFNSNLKEVVSHIEEPFAIDDDVYQIYVNGEYQFTSATLYVPAGTKAKYQQTDGWKNFQNIVEMGESSDIIQFADAEVKRICVENWDTNGDGELSEEEAAAVGSIGKVFKDNATITSFDEFQYFTGVTKMDFEAFYHCSKLTSIILPNSLKSTDQNVFCGCVMLKNIQWPENDGFSLDRGIFQHCTFTSMTLPKNLVGFSGGVFSQCYNLTEILIDKDNPYYQSIDGVVYSKDMKTIVAYPSGKELTEYSILEGVEKIGDSAFDYAQKLVKLNIPSSVKTLEYFCLGDMSNLKSLTIPENVTEIPKYCCAWDDALEEVNIPVNTTSIGWYAFAGNKVLRVVLPSTIKKIEHHAFSYNEDLKEVVSYIEEPFAIDDEVFYVGNYPDYKFTSATLYVPVGTKEKYQQTDGWKNFQNIVEMGDETGEMGDVNGDGEVDLSDAIMVIYHSLDVYSPDFIASAADMNSDGEIDLSDAIIIIYKSLGVVSNNARSYARAMNGNERMMMTFSSNECELALENAEDYVGLQCDIRVPEGITIDDIVLDNSRASHHTVMYNQIGENRYRVMVFSPTANTFDGNSGALLSFAISGNEKEKGVTVENLFLVDSQLRKKGFNSQLVTPTGIEFSGSGKSKEGWYDLSGRKLPDAPGRKGIFIQGGKKYIRK